MAITTTTTSNLRLRLSSELTTDARYNLNKIDTLGSLYQVNLNNDAIIRSINNISLLPNSADIGGIGTGGTVNIGQETQNISALNIYADSVNFSTTIGLADTAAGGSKSLFLKYKSDINGAVDTTSSRYLYLDVDGANRSVVLGGDLSVTGGALTVTLTGTTAITLPTSGTLATRAGAETFTNKIIVATSNTITALANTNIASGAAIDGTKITATFGAQPVDTADRFRFSANGFTTYLKQASSGQTANIGWELPPADGTVYQVLSTDGAGKLGWSNLTAAALSGLADVAIPGPGNGQFLAYNSTASKWENSGLATDEIWVGSSTSAGDAVSTSSVGDVLADSLTGLTIKAGKIVNAQVSSSAAIAVSKLAATTASRALVSDGSGFLAASAVTSTELGYVAGVTSALQTQINTKSVNGVAANWVTGDGTTKTVTHSLGSLDVIVQLYDKTDGSTILVDAVRTDTNTVTLTSNVAPGDAGWRVLVSNI